MHGCASEEFKAGAVRLALDEGKTGGRVARELDLTLPGWNQMTACFRELQELRDAA